MTITTGSYPKALQGGKKKPAPVKKPKAGGKVKKPPTKPKKAPERSYFA